MQTKVKLSSDTLARIDSLEFAYPNTKPILQIPQIIFNKNENVLIHGSSGSGKSTLLGLMTGILTPNKGSIEILGKSISKLRSHERDAFRGDHLGYIFQMFNLVPYLTILENILLPVHMNPKVKKKLGAEVENPVRSITESLGIGQILNQKASEISVGQAQRVAAARALISRPEIILADEPTSSLDYDNREKFIKLLFEISEKQNSTILFVTHDESLKSLFNRKLSLSEINKADK